MATSGKKGKKSKGKAMTLQNFLAEDGAPSGVTQVAKKVRNRDEDGDEDDALPQIYSLPTAPRASRMLDDTIPRDPPFQAYLANLSFDVREDDIYDFFEGYNIESLRLPREDGEVGRLRGFGYIKFGTREDLINAVSIADPHIKNRRVRIDVSNESDQNQRRGNRSRYDGFGPSENRDRESTNWRRANDGGPRDDDRRGGYGYNRDRPRDSSAETGNWRAGDRPMMDTSPGRRGGGFGGRRNNNDDYRKSDDAPQAERPKLNLKPRTLPLPEIVTQEEADVEERIPTPEPPKPKSAAPSVFGSAKPVDTAAREKEIEERLERERLEKIRKQEENEREKESQEKNEKENGEKETEEYTEKDEKENRNTISWRNRDDEEKRGSPDRRGPPIQRRNDDRKGSGRDNRDNRDRRDFNRGYDRGDNKPRDSRDRNDRNDRDNYNRDRGYSKENKSATQDNRNRDEKPKQDSRPSKTKTPAKSTGPPTASSQTPKSGPVLSSSNKYAVFIDEEELSE